MEKRGTHGRAGEEGRGKAEKVGREGTRRNLKREALKLARALEKAAKQREKDQAKREKEELKLAKQREKEEKARQKEAEKAEQQQLKQANKLRDKHACTAEMILEIDPAAVTESSGGILVAAVQAVQARVSIATQPIPTAMRWRRRVTRVWDSDAEAWRPCEERVEAEPFALVRLAAAELSRAVVRSGVGVGVGVASNMSGVREMHEGVLAAYPGAKPIYLVEGIKEFMKQRARLMDQCIKSGIRGGAAQAAGTAALPPRVATKDELDAAMLWLQMQGDCFVQVSETIDESTRYIVSFTTSISTVPERKSRSQHALRLNFGDAVKCGTDMTDIWRRMLMEVKPCNELVAEAIVGRYPTYRSLIAAFNERGARSGAAAASLLLADIEVERVKTVRPIGQALSRRIYKAFMSTDAEFAIFDPHSGG
ncbi:hypothetical protein DFJ73DRAFT_139732 [Zopfochytrium polystomum]|nr:hypothetical protein DFJ73DRAFT_139732 [Zopfochytrium polystomum]